MRLNNDNTINLLIVSVIILPIVLMALLCEYFPAVKKAELYNARFGTNYTTWDMAFGEDTIEKFHEEKVPERAKPYQIELEMKKGG